MDLLFHFPSASEQLLRAAALVCLGGTFPTSTATRLLDVLSAKAASGAADPASFCGLLLNVLSGSSRAGLRQRCWARHEALVDAACSAALGLGPPAEVASALLPPLLAFCAPSVADASAGQDSRIDGGTSSVWAAYGLLHLTTALARAAAAAQQPWQPPQAVAAALPRLVLQLQLSCQQQQQFAAAELQPPDGVDVRTTSTDAPAVGLSTHQASALCLRLLALQPMPLLAELLGTVASSVQAPQAGASLLPAALQLLLALLRDPALREALLEEQAGVQAAVSACRAAAEAEGSATLGGRCSQEQLLQLEGLCAAVLGTA